MSFDIPFDAQAILDNGWRQGTILSNEFREELGKHVPSFLERDNGIAIVVSQDCDIVHRQLENEPYIEVLAVFPIPKLDGNLTCGKSPRKYHLSIRNTQTGGVECFEAFIHNRTWLNRKGFMERKPNTAWEIDREEKTELSKWLAMRYTRAAFPDAFNQRIRGKAKEIRSLFKKEGQKLEAVYVLCRDEELPLNENYDVQILGRISDKTNENQAERMVAEKFVNQLAAIWTKCEGIIVVDSECRSESDITLSDLRGMKRWSVNDDLSFGEEMPME